ncbi:hypothetical protein D3C87_1442940 [compost metagenome]
MICTAPPAKSAGKSGVAVLEIVILSIKFEGMISNENARRLASVLGKTVPSIIETL